MTKEEREEAILHMTLRREELKHSVGVLDRDIKAFDMAIKALEQEQALDKIRAEIKQMDFDFGDFYDHTSTIREMVLKVIDKYKAESEE